MINRERMVKEFIELVKIPSHSKKEQRVAKAVVEKLKGLGIKDFFFDTAGEKIGGEVGNLIVKIKGDLAIPSLVFVVHLDTVTPGEGIEPVVEGKVIKSKGETILGADDKAAVVIILEVIRVLKEMGIKHGPLEIVFTIAEEIGLYGAKYLDYSKLLSKYGFALDSDGCQEIAIGAPTANKMVYKIMGLESHAGMAPEKGINAIKVASEAISQMRLGRIDEETTANLGVIQGGRATNIVPNLVEIHGEARSHSQEKLDRQTRHMSECFKRVIANYQVKVNDQLHQAELEEEIKSDYPLMKIDSNGYVVNLVKKAAANINHQVKFVKSGGGSDANFINKHGIELAILPCGFYGPHTLSETLNIDELVKCAELTLEIIKANAKK